jgi:hypothetical protein
MIYIYIIIIIFVIIIKYLWFICLLANVNKILKKYSYYYITKYSYSHRYNFKSNYYEKQKINVNTTNDDKQRITNFRLNNM